MGFLVLCRCDNCGLKEYIEISRYGKDSYSINYMDESEEAEAVFDTFDDVQEYTDLCFRYIFVGTNKSSPSDYKLLCGECRKDVERVDVEVAKIRQEKIKIALAEGKDD